MPKVFVEAHTTSRGDRRIKIRFKKKPSQKTIEGLRLSAKYRKGAATEPAAWYMPVENFAALRTAVGQELLGEAMDAYAERQLVDECRACTEDGLNAAKGRLNVESTLVHTLMRPHCWFSN
jgi:hypothetical protein